MNSQCLLKYSLCLAAVAMLTLGTTSSAQLLVSFEESEGFPAASDYGCSPQPCVNIFPASSTA